MTVIAFPKKKRNTPSETIDTVINQTFSFLTDRLIEEGLLDPNTVNQTSDIIERLGWSKSILACSLYSMINEPHGFESFYQVMKQTLVSLELKANEKSKKVIIESTPSEKSVFMKMFNDRSEK